MHTPEEARGLWCPMVRGLTRTYNDCMETDAVPSVAISGLNVTVDLEGDDDEEMRVPPFACCIANHCAMWRWDMTSKSEPKANTTPSGRTYTTYEQVQTKTHGYCGLAPLAQAVAG